MPYTVDFETTTRAEDCRVWACGLCNIDDVDDFTYGNSMEWFIDWCKHQLSEKVYFHNVKFDGEFILSYLLRNGYKWVDDTGNRRIKLDFNEFTTKIADTGAWYEIKICFKAEGNKQRHLITIYDSYKIIPMPVRNVAKAFGLSILKGNIDYDAPRPVGHILTTEEMMYLHNDVAIMAMALKQMFAKGLTKMTQASNALGNYKEIMGDRYDYFFPELDKETDDFIRKSYRGGFTYLKQGYSDKEVGEGLVFDVNSLYPAMMRYKELPAMEPEFFKGKYVKDNAKRLYIQHFKCAFKIKPNHIPTIQIKGCFRYTSNEYITSTFTCYGEKGDDDYREWYEDEELFLTNVDLELFLEQYDIIGDIEWIDGCKFFCAKNMFNEYIDYWTDEKIKAGKEHNKGLRQIAKLMLNALYGKFGSRTEGANKKPYLGEDNIVHYEDLPKQDRKPVYIPVATFVTAYARAYTIRSAQACYDRFVYADTDSLHILGTEMPTNLNIDPYELGAWKHESTFVKARFIRQKTYLEIMSVDNDEIEAFESDDDTIPYRHFLNKEEHTLMKVTCCGMPAGVYPHVTWENYHIGVEYKEGKLMPKRCVGGVVLENTTMKIHVPTTALYDGTQPKPKNIKKLKKKS